MKTKLCIPLLLAMLLTLTLFTSCGGNESTTADESTTAEGTTTVDEVTTEDPLATAYDDPEAYISLPALSTILVPTGPINEKVDAYFAEVLASLGRTDYLPTSEGTAAILGDCVNIHYTGRAKDESITLSESTLAGMTNATDEAGYDLVLGSGSFIDGFEEQLVGVKAGETVTIEVTFPDGYSTELSNLPVYFDVTVNSITRATVSERNTVLVTLLYMLKEGEETSELAAFMEGKEVEIDFTDMTATFDEYFTNADIKDTLLGLTLYGSASCELTLSAEDAATFGYDGEITLTAMFTVETIVYYPTELTDEEVSTFTGGDYTTVADFRQYVFDYYKSSQAYQVILAEAEYINFPNDIYRLLYDGYYDDKIYNLLGDTSSMTEEELAAALTDEIRASAESFAEENATAEYKDRMVLSYLANVLNYTLTDDAYNTKLEALFDYYYNYYYFYMIYSGITSVELFEDFYGEDTLRFEFASEEVIALLGDLVTYVD